MKMQEKQKTQEPVLQLPLPKDVTLSDSIPPEPRAPMCKGVFGSLSITGWRPSTSRTGNLAGVPHMVA